MEKNDNKILFFLGIFIAVFGFAICISKLKAKDGLDFSNPDQDPELIGGRPADLKDWPASVYASMGNARCTATVVGEKVLLIAAHCVNNGGSAQFKLFSGETYSAKCEHSPDYRRDSTADWALCVSGEIIEGIPYEVINQDNQFVKVGDEVLLTGYGCIRRGGGGGNDGIYRIGESTVKQIPGGNNDIVTRGGAALCFGDSGGPAFKYLDKEKTKRVLISVNSRGDISVTSYLSSIHTDMAKKFFKSFTDKNDVKICGMHSDAMGCRHTTEN